MGDRAGGVLVTAGSATCTSRLIVSRLLRLRTPATPSQMQPTFGPLVNTDLTVVERTLLRQANQRASERCAVAELDLKAHLVELAALRAEGRPLAELPPTLLVALRVSVEDFTSSARALYPSAEDLLSSLKQTVTDALSPNDPQSRHLVQNILVWAIDSYFAR